MAAATLTVWMLVAATAFGQSDGRSKTNSSDSGEKREANSVTAVSAAIDGVEFIKRFKLGMSYTEVQAALPKNVEQDTLVYVTTDEAFLLNVELPGSGEWSASFRFDTQDVLMRRPEHLIEMSCTASVSSRSQSFENIVERVTAAFGEPLKVERTADKIQQAGWRVGGSVLTLEYSVMPNGIGNNVTVEFIIRKNKRRAANSDDIA
ncbi:MAG TPA: hypothetical protein VJZ91_16565 [Blastocatellia bacterium]|nr:hypothetical protein [Blastocatellia bacterium]